MAVTASASRELCDRADHASVKSSRLRQGPRGWKSLFARVSGLREKCVGRDPAPSDRSVTPSSRELLPLCHANTHTHARARARAHGAFRKETKEERGEVGPGTASLWTQK